MATFLLVPGAMHGAWVWHRVERRLRRAGHRARAIDLPGTGENRSVSSRRATLAIWADYVADEISATAGDVLLVGHSRGGHVISEAAERVPFQLAGLVYVTAGLAPSGSTLFEALGVDPAASPPTPGGHFRAPTPEQAMAQFYHRSPAEDAAEAIGRLYPEAYAPSATAVRLTADRWGSVPRAYIECSDDRIVTLETQRRMLARVPCDPVITIDADHSPFFSTPKALADALLKVASRFAPLPASA